jgi:phage tail-like protein
MPVVGTPRVFDKKFAFLLRLDGFSRFGFNKVSGLDVEIAQIKYYEGGSLLPQKSLGRAEFKDLVCERGACQDFDAYVWMSSALNAAANIGLREPLYKRNGTLWVLERDGSIAKEYMLFGVFPVMFSAGEWDNNADETVIEKLTLAYDYFQRLR